jgi:hypothetical protein
LEKPVLPELKDQQDQPVLTVHPVQQAQPAPPARLALQEQLVQPALKGQSDKLARWGQPEHRDRSDRKGHRAQLVQLAPRGQPELPDLRARLARWDHLE